MLSAAAAAAALFPGAAQAAAPGQAAVPGQPPRAVTPKWTKISTDTSLGIASAGLLRTADGMLHVAWPRNDTGSFSLNYSTVGPNAKLEATGTIVKGWSGVSAYPRLVAGPSGGIRAVFTGATAWAAARTTWARCTRPPAARPVLPGCWQRGRCRSPRTSR